jgi:hypothetical protein
MVWKGYVGGVWSFADVSLDVDSVESWCFVLFFVFWVWFLGFVRIGLLVVPGYDAWGCWWTGMNLRV